MLSRFSRYAAPLAALAATAALVGAPAAANANTTATAVKPQIAGVCGSYYSGAWPPPTVRQGSVDTDGNSAVKLAQCYLNNSVLSVNLVIDGRFGAQTNAATVLFQGANCANVPPVDGIIGRNTWNALNFWANSSGWAC